MLRNLASIALAMLGLVSAESTSKSKHDVYYLGGPVLSNVHIVPFYWSTQVSYKYDEFYKQLTTSKNFRSTLKQYNVNGSSIDSATVGKSFTYPEGDSTGPLDTLSVIQIMEDFINEKVADVTKQTVYVPIHFPPGVEVMDCSKSCSFHGFDTYFPNGPDGAGYRYYYSLLPDVSAGTCKGCVSGTGSGFGDNCASATAAFVDTITDPVGDNNGWVTTSYEEVTYACSNKTAGFCGSDGYKYSVNKIWSNKAESCVGPTDKKCPKGTATGK